jgi:hypothetical protein
MSHDDDDGEDGDDDTVLGPNACKFWLKGCGQEKSHCSATWKERVVMMKGKRAEMVSLLCGREAGRIGC